MTRMAAWNLVGGCSAGAAFRAAGGQRRFRIPPFLRRGDLAAFMIRPKSGQIRPPSFLRRGEPRKEIGYYFEIGY